MSDLGDRIGSYVAGLICIGIVLCGAVGWLVIEGLIWLASHINISVL